MKKIISMLLAVSMSLSVMCSSFTVTAVDGNDTAAQTDSFPAEFSSLFSNELSEKTAALSDDYGITSVEVNVSDGTAKVSYHAVSDCTVIVGIYEDDGTDTGTHMLTFGTAAVSAANTVSTVAINESLPEYFYVKAYIVEQGTFKPLAREYTSPNYTKTVQDFLELTILDFIEAGYDDEHILNLDGSDSNNFMVFDKRAKILNFDTQISVDDLTLTSSVLTVKQNADAEPDIANLKKGDPFLFFTTKGVLAGIASSVSYDGSSAVINYTEATTADVFDHIRVDTSDITPRQSAAAYSARSNNRTVNVFPIDKTDTKTIKIETPAPDPNNKPIVGASGSLTLTSKFKGDLTVSYGKRFKELVAELNITPTITIEISGEGHIGKPITLGEATVPIVGGVGVANVIGLKFAINIQPNITYQTALKATFSTTMSAKVDTNKEFSDMISFGSNTNSPELELNGTASVKFTASFSIGLAVLEIDLGTNDKKALFNLDLIASVIPSVEVGAAVVIGDSKKHICKPFECFDGKMSIDLVVSVAAKTPVLKLASGSVSGGMTQTTPLGTLRWIRDTITLEIAKRNIWPEEMQKFNIKLNPYNFSWNECDNYAYRTYFYAEDSLTGNRIKDIFVYTKDLKNSDPNYSEDITNRGGMATLYIKPKERIKIGFGDVSSNIYKDTETYVTIADPNEEYTVKMDVGVPPSYIEPRPTETDEVPTFHLGENLRYTTLMVKYGIFDEARTYYIDFTEDMIKSFDPNTLGEQTLVIEYNGTTWSQKIKIIEDERHIDSISINTPPNKTDYDIGEDFDVTGLTINAKFKDGTTSDKPIAVSSGWVSGFDSSAAGEKELTVTYTDKYGDTATAKFTVTVGKGTVEKIEMVSLPEKTEYNIGEALYLGGAQIRIIYADGSEPQIKTVTKDMVSGYDNKTAGDKTITVTYKDAKGNTHTTEFTVTVNAKEVEKIEVLQLLDQNKYCQINGNLNLEKAIIKVYNADGTFDLVQITEDMISGFDSSRLGIFPVTVTYCGKTATYDVEVLENLKKVIHFQFRDVENSVNSDNGIVYLDGYDGNNSSVRNVLEEKKERYSLIEYFADGTYEYVDARGVYITGLNYSDGGFFEESYNTYYTVYIHDDNNNVIITDHYGGKIQISSIDLTKYKEIQKVTATYFSPDGTPDVSVKQSSTWIMLYNGRSGFQSNSEYFENPEEVFKEEIYDGKIILPEAFHKEYGNTAAYDCPYMIGDSFNWSDYGMSYLQWWYNDSRQLWTTLYLAYNERYPNEKYKYELSNATLLGGFDTSYPHEGFAFFEYEGYVFTLRYSVKALEVENDLSQTTAYNMDYSDYSHFDNYGFYDWTYEPAFTDETETLDNTDKNTDETDSTEPTETEVTEPVDTETTDTEQQPEETTVTETADVEETPVFAIDNNGVFGFGRAGIKTAQFANLNKNDIYNCYVVKSMSADILGKDNLLFVGQTSSDGMGNLSFEYETTTGEDGTIILRPMSGDPTTPGNPSQPTVPDNGESSSNTNTSVVVPFGGANTVSLTVTVENKVTGKTSKARGQKTGSSVTINLGKENNGYYANVYTTDGEYIYSALIENGRAKFNVSDDVKLKIVIDSIAYGEDVSSASGVFGDSAAKSLPYAAITVMIAVVGIYFKKRSEKKVK